MCLCLSLQSACKFLNESAGMCMEICVYLCLIRCVYVEVGREREKEGERERERERKRETALVQFVFIKRDGIANKL